MVAHLFAVAALLACDISAPPLIAAHRGGMDSGHPENTLPAFRHAAAVGAQVIELDLRTTRDGHVVVMHDPSVDRTSDGRGLVRDLSLAELQRLDLGGGIRIPTLVDVLEATRPLPVTLLFDVKRAPGLSHAELAARVAERHDPARVIFGVRSPEDRERLARAAPGLRYLGLVPAIRSIDAFLAAGVEAIRLWPGWLDGDPGLVRYIHDAGARVWVTAGRASTERLAAHGVDAVLTDYPAAAVSSLGCR